MAMMATHVDTTSTATAVVGRQRASHWLFSRLEGLQGVLIPETGLFGAEGVCDAWIFAGTPKTNQDASPRCWSVITRHDVLQTSLLRLEARFQVRITLICIDVGPANN